jgi:hypothetical protein
MTVNTAPRPLARVLEEQRTADQKASDAADCR